MGVAEGPGTAMPDWSCASDGPAMVSVATAKASSSFMAALRWRRTQDCARRRSKLQPSGRVDQHHLGVFQGGDAKLRLAGDGRAVAGVEAHAVDLDRAGRWN